MKIERVLVGLFCIPVAYLISVAIWATVYTETFVSSYREIPDVDISKRRSEILLSVEDPRFFSHWGIDLSDGQGLTTMTSAIVPQIYYRGQRLEGFAGRLQSLYFYTQKCCKKIDIGRDLVAIVLNAKASKEEQLQLYLKTVYMGGVGGAQYVGFENAAQAYYAKPMNELSEQEFIGLVAMPLAPNLYHPLKNVHQHALRRDRISRLVTGECSPSGWFDLEYEQCDA